MTDDASTPSGRFLLRIDPALHAALRRAAETAGTSLNEHCARRLAGPATGAATVDGTIEAVTRAAEIAGGALLAVAVFGSWARGEATGASDVDLLVVVDDGLELTRDLYRRWDREPLEIDGLPAAPHFVHLPGDRGAGESPATSGFWAEVALDAVVLFERGLALSRTLARVRHRIAAGRLVRRVADGQTYWVEAA